MHTDWLIDIVYKTVSASMDFQVLPWSTVILHINATCHEREETGVSGEHIHEDCLAQEGSVCKVFVIYRLELR